MLTSKFNYFIRITPILTVTVFTITTLVLFLTQNFLYADEIEVRKLKGSSISWGTKYFFDAPRFKEDQVQELFDKEISKKLKTFGISITDKNSNNNNYVLNYTVVLGDTATKAKLEELFAQDPELKESENYSKNFEHGKLSISISNSKTYKTIWSNAIEGFAYLELDNEARQKRVKTVVNQAFATFPIEPISSH